jgi:hypothetical protein
MASVPNTGAADARVSADTATRTTAPARKPVSKKRKYVRENQSEDHRRAIALEWDTQIRLISLGVRPGFLTHIDSSSVPRPDAKTMVQQVLGPPNHKLPHVLLFRPDLVDPSDVKSFEARGCQDSAAIGRLLGYLQPFASTAETRDSYSKFVIFRACERTGKCCDKIRFQLWHELLRHDINPTLIVKRLEDVQAALPDLVVTAEWQIRTLPGAICTCLECAESREPLP